jgi:hypothetical protein
VAFDVDLDTPVLRGDGSTGVAYIGLSNIPPEPKEEKSVIVSKILERHPFRRQASLRHGIQVPHHRTPPAKCSAQVRSYAFAGRPTSGFRMCG